MKHDEICLLGLGYKHASQFRRFSVGDRRIKSTSNLFPVTMKGLIFVLLMLGFLLISAPETRGQPVPDGGMVSDQEAEDNDMSIIGLMSVPDSAPEGSASGTSSTEDDVVGETTSVPDSATEESLSSQEDDGVSGTSFTFSFGNMCRK